MKNNKTKKNKTKKNITKKINNFFLDYWTMDIKQQYEGSVNAGKIILM
jgi:hypothetical protein